MRKKQTGLLTKVLAIFAGLLAVVPAAAQPKVINAQVLAVGDADTITIRDFRGETHQVRLRGVIARGTTREVATAAREYLSALTNGKWVRISNIKYDRKGTLVGKVTQHGRDISLEMVIAGFAAYFIGWGHELEAGERQLFEAAENHARRLRLNIWGIKSESAPKR